MVVESFEFVGAHRATSAVCGQALVKLLTTTARDPAHVGKIVLCSLVASAKVEMPANCLTCIVGGSLHVVGTTCWVAPYCGVVPAGVVVSHSCSLPKKLVISLGCYHRVGCEELADDVLVLHQLKSGFGCNLNAICSMLHPGAEIQDLPPSAALLSHLAN